MSTLPGLTIARPGKWIQKLSLRISRVFLISIPGISLIFLFSCSNRGPEIKYTAHEFSNEISYTNPVIKGFAPDPSICKAGDDYYLVTSSFEFFPGVPVFHSRDLVNWDQIGNALDRPSQLPLKNVNFSGGIFAPTIRYHDGLFYMITTLMHEGRNFLVTAKDPSGPWSEPVFIEQQNIDPSLFFDEDGRVYYTGTAPWGENEGQGVYQAEIDPSTGKLLTAYKKIWAGTGGRYPEGPHLYKMGDWYYLMISEGGTETGHMVVISRSRDPWGPFEECPRNPILTNRNEPFSNPVQNSGHADLITDASGKWWMVHLAVRNVNKHHHLGRETFLLPVDWDDEGWPIVNQNGVSYLEIHARTPGQQIRKNPYGKYDFSSGPLGPEWNYIRNPDLNNYFQDEEQGILWLKGNELSLSDKGSPAFVGIRQKDFNVELTGKLEFQTQKDKEEAGLVAFMNEDHHYTIGMIRKDGLNFVRAGFRIGDIFHELYSEPLIAKNVHLKIDANRESYALSYSLDGEKWTVLGKNHTRYLSSETAVTFTGVYLGMYATGNGNVSSTPAGFHYFDYIIRDSGVNQLAINP